ncbi:hypothetical protein FKW77_001150 [Venturia effusa]|uniref:Uncharacterized protein n=1 Tax=Venturia effusa TaxID=50376 RepID=A0A517L4U7_9PEZI|nr:hypothetical protein FKW77_001150 [Venturia effusa]
MSTQLRPAKFVDGELQIPTEEEWDGMYLVPPEVKGILVSQLLNIVTAQSDAGHHCAHKGCPIPTTRCFNDLGHMSFCKHWPEGRDKPCGFRCPDAKGYCKMHKKFKPADCKTTAEKAAETITAAEASAENRVNGPIEEAAEDADPTYPVTEDSMAQTEVAQPGTAENEQEEILIATEEDAAVHFREEHARHQQPVPAFSEKRVKIPRQSKKTTKAQQKADKKEAKLEEIQTKYGANSIRGKLLARVFR